MHLIKQERSDAGPVATGANQKLYVLGEVGLLAFLSCSSDCFGQAFQGLLKQIHTYSFANGTRARVSHFSLTLVCFGFCFCRSDGFCRVGVVVGGGDEEEE